MHSIQLLRKYFSIKGQEVMPQTLPTLNFLFTCISVFKLLKELSALGIPTSIVLDAAVG